MNNEKRGIQTFYSLAEKIDVRGLKTSVWSPQLRQNVKI